MPGKYRCTMKHRFKFSFLIGLTCTVGVVFAQTTDDTADLRNHILAVSNGTMTTLEARTYYVRGKVTIDVNDFNNLRTNNKTLKIIGSITTGSGGGDRTRIVHGQGFFENVGGTTKKWRTWSELGTDDPWKNRFSATDVVVGFDPPNNKVRDVMRWVDIDEYTSASTFFTEWNPTEKDVSYGPNSPKNAVCVTIQGLPLIFDGWPGRCIESIISTQ